MNKSDRIPLLLIHGIACDHTWFDPLIPYLSDAFIPVCFDRRGYGLPAAEITDHSIPAQVQDALQAIAGMSAPVYVLGHSAGCIMAAELALQYPEKVKGVLLFEPSFGLPEEDRKRLDEWREQIEQYARERRLDKILRSFQSIAGIERKSTPPSKDSLRRTLHNLENYAYGELHAIRTYRPDPAAFSASAVPMAVGVSEQGEQSLFGQVSIHDAQALHLPLYAFPGSHNGLIDHPSASAERIKHIVSEMEEGQ